MSFHRYQPSTEQPSSVTLWCAPVRLAVCYGSLGNRSGFLGAMASDQEGNN